jgi:hypothetical protein
MAHLLEHGVTLQTVLSKETFEALSLKEFISCGLELYLSMSLGISFFECPDESRRDEQELQTLYTMSWMPALLSTLIVYGSRLSPRFGPAPQNFERNVRYAKILTWIYSAAFLINDKDMTFKSGPGLTVAIVFCICDMVRFEIEISGVLESEEDDDELERLAAALHNANGGDKADKQYGGESYQANSSVSYSTDNLFPEAKKQLPRTLDRQSTQSVTQEYMEMITPAQSDGSSAINPGGIGNDTTRSHAPSISTGRSVNHDEPLAPQTRMSKNTVVFEF